VTETGPNAAAFHAVPLAEYTEVATLGQKVAAHLMGALGLLCLVLAASGLYSVMSYTVSQRIPEIGIRMAMGARPGNVIAMVVRQGMGLALAGIAVGAVAAYAAARLVASLLFRVDAADPATFVLAGLFLSSVTLAATWLPAFRATRIDPMLALRR
jgi:putative ABC transport system permease protein